MIQEVLPFINKRKKELAGKLAKGKTIDMMGYFIIESQKGYSDIIIPGVPAFEDKKEQLRLFIQQKWDAYSKKAPMKLAALIIESHIFMSRRKMPDELQRDQLEKWAKEQAKNLPFAPSDDPNAIRAIGFMIFTEKESRGYVYPYEWRAKHLVFTAPMEDGQLSNVGNFGTHMFPNI